MQFILGQISGKQDGLGTQMNQMAVTSAAQSTQVMATITAHALSDEKNLRELREEMARDREAVAKSMKEERDKTGNDRVKLAGLVATVSLIVSVVVPLIVQQLTK